MIWLFVFWLLAMIFGIFAILLVLASGVINYEKKQDSSFETITTFL